MPAGLQIWNAQGIPILDITSRLGIYLGTVSSGTPLDGPSSRYISVPGFALGTPFAFAVGEVWAMTGEGTLPIITTSSSRLSWTWNRTTGRFQEVTIIYGIY